MNRIPNSDAISNLKRILANDGVRAAVVYLNSLTRHRFTSLYRFDGETLHNLIFYDRENPEIQNCSDIPVLASYCVFVRESRATFATHDAQQDERVGNHPKRKTVQAYCGVPLLDQDGKMFGTICHFDFKPGRIADVDVEFLECMAPLLHKQL
ncbi:MAG: GAF domain-containing protein [Burkholderiales bacterium]|nr:GAF domain-containing protein [Burkholderiales bacterium]